MGEVALIVIGIVTLAAIGFGRQLTIRVGQMHATVKGIDRAVNHRQPGEPVLVEQVDRVAADVADLQETAEEIRSRVGACEEQLCALTDDHTS